MRVSAFECVCRCCRYKPPCSQDGFSLLRNTSLMHLSICLFHLSVCASQMFFFFFFVISPFPSQPFTIQGLLFCLVVFTHSVVFVAQSMSVDLAAVLLSKFMVRVRWDWPAQKFLWMLPYTRMVKIKMQPLDKIYFINLELLGVLTNVLKDSSQYANLFVSWV